MLSAVLIVAGFTEAKYIGRRKAADETFGGIG
jgi:hypothetical protein